jgi:hypothetical protein
LRRAAFRTTSRDPRGRRRRAQRARFARAPCRCPYAPATLTRFYEEQSEIASELAKLARRVALRTGRPTPVGVSISEGRRGRLVASSLIVNGRRIVVQKRHSFAVYVGERPVKKA